MPSCEPLAEKVQSLSEMKGGAVLATVDTDMAPAFDSH